MKRRLRKKLRRGEFEELGFEIAFTLNAPPGSDDALDVIDEFLAGAIEPLELALYAGGGQRWTGFIRAFGRGSVTESHRATVLEWLAGHPRITDAKAGLLIDAW